jgi:hypothetical protein
MNYDDSIILKILKAINTYLRNTDKEPEEIFLRNNNPNLMELDSYIVFEKLNWLEHDQGILELIDSDDNGYKIKVMRPGFDIYLNTLWTKEKEDQDNKYAKDKVLHYGPLTLDLLKPEFIIDKYPPIIIKPDNQVIKFLQILIQKQGKIAAYADMAKFIHANWYYENGTNSYFGPKLREVKKNLLRDFKAAGLSIEAVEVLRSMIKAHKNTGYSLSTNNPS